MKINKIGKECIKTAREHGFSPNEDIDNIEKNKWYLASKLALIHSEISEMLEAIREDNWNNMIEEGIDVIIRTLEYLSCLKDVNIEEELYKKMEINKNRKFKHGNKLI